MFTIGLDFGNYYSYPSYIASLDPAAGRLAGRPVDLLPGEANSGIPSIFFYSSRAAQRCLQRGTAPPPWYGMEALGGRATPSKNRIRYLKSRMSMPLVLDDWNGTYDEAITLLLQHIVREANRYLQRDTTETSNHISLAYPATFTRAQCQHLKQLAEMATLEDGTPIEVVGMIAEPAAAALDYLVDNGRATTDCTVLTYDLGGGTFDLAIVSAHPQGVMSPQGTLRYYDIQSLGGDASIGGIRFDAVMKALLVSKIPEGSHIRDDELNRIAEEAKIALTTQEEETYSIIDDSGEEQELTVTRAEFEARSRHLVDATIKATRDILTGYKGPAPELIVLTGAASQMPMIKAALEREFPQYRGKVALFRPSRAISYGAARFGVNEDDVQPRVPRDLGIRFAELGGSRRHYILTFLTAGTPLPCASKDETAYANDSKSVLTEFHVYEARVEKPDKYAIDRDYRSIMSVTLSHEAGASMVTRLVLDSMGLLKVEAELQNKPDTRVDAFCSLENLSDS